jgi:NAD(P)-dependent dehydrogenase (short-subunit alcohol dehydrogenase family)
LQKDDTVSVRSTLSLTGRVIVITGAAGLLGTRHAEAVAEMGGVPILADLNALGAEAAAAEIRAQYGGETMWLRLDVTDLAAVEKAKDQILERYGRIDGLVNNAANNPKVGAGQPNWTRLENFPLKVWSDDLAVGLTGALLCARVFGAEMARRGGGAIVNIASDLALIGPDQRLYRNINGPEEAQPVKPVSYSVIKSGLLGLTRYLATYWAQHGVRANALCPGGVYAGEDADFVQRLTNLIPMGRMANRDEYKGCVVFLLSDASRYMTGAIMTVDGGRTAW